MRYVRAIRAGMVGRTGHFIVKTVGNGGGQYVTGMCSGEMRVDSGKAHNHCMMCKDYGMCIGDIREAHCPECAAHYFAGREGFCCTECGWSPYSSSGRQGVAPDEEAFPGSWTGYPDFAQAWALHQDKEKRAAMEEEEGDEEEEDEDEEDGDEEDNS